MALLVYDISVTLVSLVEQLELDCRLDVAVC